jgi:uncharacterized protein YqgC (DUF456 family)
MRPKVRKACGVGLIVLGVPGLVLPILPGIPLILAGLIMLEINHPLVHACRDWLEARGIGKKKPPVNG